MYDYSYYTTPIRLPKNPKPPRQNRQPEPEPLPEEGDDPKEPETIQ